MTHIKKASALLLGVLMLCFCFLPLCAETAKAESGVWVAAWSTSIVDSSVTPLGLRLHDVIPARSTLRTELTVTVGGSCLEFIFSNKFGTAPITINAASVAKTDGEGQARIKDGTQTFITFNGGNLSVTIPAGETVTSDKIPFRTEPLERISVSTFFRNLTYMTSSGLANGRTFMRTGLADTDARVSAAALPGRGEINITSSTITYHTIPFLETVNTLNPSPYACTAVFIGDSTLVNDTYLYYAKRIISAKVNNIAVINKAIIGNKLLSDGSGLIGNLYGKAMRDRFEGDVLDEKGVKYCFVKIGLNDILHQFSKSLSADTPKNSPEQIINGYRELIARCHARGIKIYFFTKSPWKGYARSFLGQSTDLEWNQEAQNMCDALNRWILTSYEHDGSIDCSPLGDPSEPVRLCPSFTLDGAHLTDLGSVALADLIPMEYVALTTSSARSAAAISGTDPYAEKREIQSRLAQAAAAPTAASNTQNNANTGGNTGRNTGTAPSQNQTVSPTSPAVPAASAPAPAVTVPQVPAPTGSFEAYTVPEISPAQEQTPTAPYTPEEPYSSPAYYQPELPDGQDMQYVIDGSANDSGSIGSGVKIMIVLIVVTLLLAAGTVVILTIGRKREGEPVPDI